MMSWRISGSFNNRCYSGTPLSTPTRGWLKVERCYRRVKLSVSSIIEYKVWDLKFTEFEVNYNTCWLTLRFKNPLDALALRLTCRY